MITLRLDAKLEKNINDSARLLGVSKSELIRKSIEEYLKKFTIIYEVGLQFRWLHCNRAKHTLD